MAISTFGSFTQARLGIYASQAGLSVTGNNISNINTPGYSRQKLVQTSLYTGGSDRYYSSTSISVGSGVLCQNVTQFRDPYLDIRYRSEMSSAGAMNQKLNGLSDIQRILDEFNDGKDGFGVLGAKLSDFYKQLQNMSDQTNRDEYDLQVRSAAEALTKLFNSYSSQLSEIKQNAEKVFQKDITTVNNILTSIRDLSVNIRKAELHGDGALELRDERNVLIDQLSSYMKIDVQYTMEDVGGGTMLEKLTIKLDDKNGGRNFPALVDGTYCTQLSDKRLDGTDNTNLLISLDALKDSQGHVLNGSTPTQLGDNDMYGSLQSQREILTKSGEFCTDAELAADPNAASKRGIPYYQKTLDLLAKQFAETFNKANQGYVRNEKGEYVKKDGTVINWRGAPITDATFDGLSAQDTAELNNFLKDPANGAQHLGKPLFSNSGNGDVTTDISAANISVSKSWSTSAQIVASFVQHGDSIASTDSSNISHMLVLMNTKMDFSPDGKNIPMYNGTFNEMWTNIGTVLGHDMMSTTVLLDTYQGASVQLDSSRSGVSGVDLNDEAMNLMQYSKSYSAACRLMTTIDSILDKLINGTGTLT